MPITIIGDGQHALRIISTFPSMAAQDGLITNAEFAAFMAAGSVRVYPYITVTKLVAAGLSDGSPFMDTFVGLEASDLYSFSKVNALNVISGSIPPEAGVRAYGRPTAKIAGTVIPHDGMILTSISDLSFESRLLVPEYNGGIGDEVASNSQINPAGCIFATINSIPLIIAFDFGVI
jgi:hypothetical protein